MSPSQSSLPLSKIEVKPTSPSTYLIYFSVVFTATWHTTTLCLLVSFTVSPHQHGVYPEVKEISWVPSLFSALRTAHGTEQAHNKWDVQMNEHIVTQVIDECILMVLGDKQWGSSKDPFVLSFQETTPFLRAKAARVNSETPTVPFLCLHSKTCIVLFCAILYPTKVALHHSSRPNTFHHHSLVISHLHWAWDGWF